LALTLVGVVSVRNIVTARDRADAERDTARRRLATAYVDRARAELAAEHPDRALAFAAAAAQLGSPGADLPFAPARALDALPELHRYRAGAIAGVAFVPGTHDLIVAGSAGLARWQREATLWSVPGAAADLAILGPHELVARRDDGIAIVSADDGHA